MSKKITVINQTKGQVSIVSQDLRFNRTWNGKGHKVQIDEEVLKELMFERGVGYMFQSGILVLEGASTEDYLEKGIISSEEEMPLLIEDKDFEAMLTTMPVAELKDKLAKLSNTQIQNLVDFAVEKEMGDASHLNTIKGVTKRDIYRMISNKKTEEEEAKKAKE